MLRRKTNRGLNDVCMSVVLITAVVTERVSARGPSRAWKQHLERRHRRHQPTHPPADTALTNHVAR